MLKYRSLLNYLTLDLRSVGLFRIGLGLLLLVDLFFRLFLVNDFYTDLGAIPRGPLISELSNSYHFSVFNIAGKNFYIYFLCLLAAVSYFCLTVGYKTKLANLFSWIFFVSFSARAPILSHGGDDLIRLSLFWLFFLPSQTYFSFDRSDQERDDSKKKGISEDPQILNFASMAFMLQLIAMYFFTAILKVHPRWLGEGTAIYYALELDQFLTSFGLLFRDVMPLGFLKIMTQMTYFIEFVFPFFLLIPVLSSHFRKVAIGTFVFFHFGLFMIFKLGTFPWICMLYWLAMIPSDFWTTSRTQRLGTFFARRPDFLKTSNSLGLQFYKSPFVQGFVAVCLGIALYWNIAGHSEDDDIQVTGTTYTIGSVLRLHQHWNMFAPYPILNDGWVVVEGNLMNGKVWDILHDQPYTLNKPDKVSSMFQGTHWRKYLYNISSSEYSNHLVYFGRYLCRTWNTDRLDNEVVDTFKVYYIREKTKPPGEPKASLEQQLVWDHYCFSRD